MTKEDEFNKLINELVVHDFTVRPLKDPNGRWKHMTNVFEHKGMEVNLGNMTKFTLVFHIVSCTYGQPASLFFGVVGKGCYIFNGVVVPSYVEEKLGVMGGDATNLADFINALNGEYTQFGNYYDHLCRSE